MIADALTLLRIAWIAGSIGVIAFFSWDVVAAQSDRRHLREEQPGDRAALAVATFIVALRVFFIWVGVVSLAFGILVILPASAPRSTIGPWLLGVGGFSIVYGLLAFGVWARAVRVRLGRLAVLR